MTRISHVLCPIDFSDTSRHALDHAAALARWYDAQLTVLHVAVSRPAMDLPPLPFGEAERAGLLAEMRRATAHLPAGLRVALQLEEAFSVDEEVLAQAGRLEADMLVIGTHGRSGVRRLLLGSVTEKVIRHARCHTLVVPPRAETVSETPPNLRRLVCAVDFSESSLDALALAFSLAQEADAHLTLLHVVESVPLVPNEGTVGFDLSRLEAEAAESARRRLDGLIPDAVRSYCRVDIAVSRGRTGDRVLSQAEADGADLIVVGVQGSGAIDRLVFGSTTLQVIRQARCPVLIARRV